MMPIKKILRFQCISLLINHQAINNIAWLIFDKAMRLGISLLIGTWVARYFGPEQYGMFNFALAFITLFIAFSGLGLQGIVIRDIIVRPHRAKLTLGTAGFILGLGGILTYPLIAATILLLRPNDSFVQHLVLIIGLIVFFKLSEISLYWFESQVSSKSIVLSQTIVLVIFAAIKIWLIINECTLTAFAWLFVAESLTSSILLFLTMNFMGVRIRSLKANFRHARSLLSDSFPLLISGISVTLFMKIDQIMLGEMIGDESVGIYSAAVRLSEVWYFVPIIVINSFFPLILEKRNICMKIYEERIKSLYGLVTLLSICIVLPIMLFSSEIIYFLYGDAYSGADAILMVHIWGIIFVSFGTLSGRYLIAEGLQYLNVQRALLGVVINIILNLFLIPYFGAIGAAWASLISYIFAAFLFDLFQAATRETFYMKIKAFNFIETITALLKDLQRPTI